MWLFHAKFNKNVFVANVQYFQSKADHYVLWYDESAKNVLLRWKVDPITLFSPPKDEGK
jgi:hypothetical protein